MASRIARRNTPERLAELKRAKARRKQIIANWISGLSQELLLAIGSCRDLRLLRRMIPKDAALTNLTDCVHSEDVCIREQTEDVDELSDEIAGNLQRICAARKPPAFKKGGPGAKRQGAKAKNKLERAADAAHILKSEEASLYRALAACANLLSQDRPDTHFDKGALQGLFPTDAHILPPPRAFSALFDWPA